MGVGAGLVGALEAIYLAKRGAEVHIYEYREDIRKMEHVPGRSINLAMSVRGLAALRKVGLDEHMKTEYGIPMHARMIHSPAGSLNAIPYGKDGEAIYSVGRRYVNEILLDEGDKEENISYHFSHKLIKAELDDLYERACYAPALPKAACTPEYPQIHACLGDGQPRRLYCPPAVSGRNDPWCHHGTFLQ